MSFVSELAQVGFKSISKKAAKFLNGMPVQDIAPTIRAATKNPNEVADLLKDVESIANGDQSKILSYIQKQNKFGNNATADIRDSQTLTHGINKGSNNQGKLYSENVVEPNSPQVVQDTSGVVGRSEAKRAFKATKTQGARSVIAGTPNTIIKAEPHNADKAMKWARETYAYAQQGKSGNKAMPLLGAPRYVGEDGTLYKGKTNVGSKGGYQLKFVSMDLLKGYDDLRKMREAPWRKQEVIDQLQTILTNQGKGDKLDDLLKIMLKDYSKKLKSIKAAGQTKGHFISLEKGGFDIAENFGPQRGKSIKNKSGEYIKGNYAEKADSSIPEGVSVPTTWEEYVALKLPLLK
tara:strand:+ start:626 stop:1672 length:1047 start_codon:yes stop_codon:yes gene_type:complete